MNGKSPIVLSILRIKLESRITSKTFICLLMLVISNKSCSVVLPVKFYLHISNRTQDSVYETNDMKTLN